MQGGKLLAQGKEARVTSQTSKPNSEELRVTFPMSGQTITLLPADYSALHELNILLSALTFSVANQRY